MKAISHQLSALSSQKGVTLLLTLIFMVALMGIAVTYLALVHQGTRSAGLQVNDEQTFYLADAGIDYAIYQLKLNDAWDEDAAVEHYLPSAQTYKFFAVDIEALPDPDYKRITSTATLKAASGKVLSLRRVRQDVKVE